MRTTIRVDEDLLVHLYETYRGDIDSLNRRLAALGFIGQFGDAEGEILYLLLRHARPAIALEVSPGIGWTSCYMLAALADNAEGELYSFDLVGTSELNIPVDLCPPRRIIRTSEGMTD